MQISVQAHEQGHYTHYTQLPQHVITYCNTTDSALTARVPRMSPKPAMKVPVEVNPNTIWYVITNRKGYFE